MQFVVVSDTKCDSEDNTVTAEEWENETLFVGDISAVNETEKREDKDCSFECDGDGIAL